jgi:hypothetical protein
MSTVRIARSAVVRRCRDRDCDDRVVVGAPTGPEVINSADAESALRRMTRRHGRGTFRPWSSVIVQR